MKFKLPDGRVQHIAVVEGETVRNFTLRVRAMTETILKGCQCTTTWCYGIVCKDRLVNSFLNRDKLLKDIIRCLNDDTMFAIIDPNSHTQRVDALRYNLFFVKGNLEDKRVVPGKADMCALCFEANDERNSVPFNCEHVHHKRCIGYKLAEDKCPQCGVRIPIHFREVMRSLSMLG